MTMLGTQVEPEEIPEKNKQENKANTFFKSFRECTFGHMKWPSVDVLFDPDRQTTPETVPCMTFFDALNFQMCGRFGAMPEHEIEECRCQFRETIQGKRAILDSIIAQNIAVWECDEGENGLFVFENLLILTEPEQNAPITVVRQYKNKSDKSTRSKSKQNEQLPVILVIPDNESSVDYLISSRILQRLACKGFLVVGVDCRFQGKRVPRGTDDPHDVYMNALVRAYESGGLERPFLYDNIWDFMRILDYLQTRNDVDARFIGTTGVSLGGMHSLYLAFADERITATAPVNGVHAFSWAIENGIWEPLARQIWPVFEICSKKLGKREVDVEVARTVWSTLCPGILDIFDAPRIISAIAPRALFIGQEEEILEAPIQGVRKAYQIAKSSYTECDATNELVLYVERMSGPFISETMWEMVDIFFMQKLKIRQISTSCS